MTDTLPMHALVKSARTWRPEPGDVLKGHVVTVQRRSTEFGPYPMVVMEVSDDAGNEQLVAVHAFHTVLKNELTRVRPTPGSYLEVAYLGMQPSAKRKDANGQPVQTHVYSCSDGTEEELASWDQAWGDISKVGF
jgi:hypothetical protein